MAKTLESPLEALALNYLSYGFFLAVNSIWAWVTVVTAALSLWRIRASSSSPPPRDTSNDGAASESALSPPAENCVKGGEGKLVALSAAVAGSDREGEFSRKTKFRLCYKEDDFCRENDEDGEAEEEGTGIKAAAAVKRKLGRFCDDWEQMMAMRMGDLGWYRWVDTAALDGSVVRLWDAPPRTPAVVI